MDEKTTELIRELADRLQITQRDLELTERLLRLLYSQNKGDTEGG